MSAQLTRLERLARRLADRPRHRVEDPARKLAAVALILAPDPDALLMIRRAEREGDKWSGQMALPGGRWQADDPDLEATARRETHEEVGIDLTAARRVGVLDDVAPRTPTLPPLIVRPYVFLLPAREPPNPNHEVAVAFWASLETLVQPGIYRPYDFELPAGRLRFPGYHLNEGVVWGMTERILTPLLELVLETDATR